MSHFRLHMKEKEKHYLLAAAAGILLAVVVSGYVAHSIGTARAKSRETVLLYTEEELEQYLLDEESGEYNLNGNYRLEEDLDLSWLYQSIGTNIEPFTGKLDGNGHVISGLTRPLFGVMEGAEVENLFLGGAVIENPFTYYDGEHYVDGYGALAAYAIDSVIRNCGMNGEIDTASPSEAEYLVERASPSNIDEFYGPGVQESTVARDTSAGNADISGEKNTAESNETEKGPGIETDGNQAAETTAIPSEEDSTTAVNEENESPVSSGESGEHDAESEEGSSQSSDATEEDRTGDGEEADTKPEKLEPEGTKKDGSEQAQEDKSGADSRSVQDEPASMETVGYWPLNRQRLALKVSSTMEADAEEYLAASPSNAEEMPSMATLSNAVKSKEEAESSRESLPEETEPQYIGNPNGDICILVTADRVTAGGLVAQTEGEVFISNSFALITIASELETETYTGGLAAILGEGSRTENSYATGLVDGDGVSGGFAAVNEGSIENCYSTATVGEDGRIRGAFTASGNGSLSGCVYDWQMACVEEYAEGSMPENEENSLREEGKNPLAEITTASDASEAEFHLKAIDTSDMTGTESTIPGKWYTTEYAYPQIEYFAMNDHETIAAASKVSAVALILPKGTSLFEMLQDSEIILPSEIDGEQIQWDAKGVAISEDNSQIKIETEAAISPNDIPIVKAAMENSLNMEEDPADEIPLGVADEVEENDKVENKVSEKKGVGGDLQNDTIELNATVRNISRRFSLMTSRTVELTGTDYVSWEKVAEDWSAAGNTLTGGDGSQKKPYLIGSAEELALFAYRVNLGETGLCAKMTTDINLFGSKYAGVVDADATIENIDRALGWVSIGDEMRGMRYTGTFDGGGFQIDSVLMCHEVYASSNSGFFGTLGEGAVIQNLGINSGKLILSGNRGSIVGKVYGTGVKILNCWNKVSPVGGGTGGGILGWTIADDLLIENCSNMADIKDGNSLGGIVGSGNKMVIRNCYSTGNVSGGSSRNGGIAGDWPNSSIENCYFNKQYFSSGGIGVTEEQMKTWAFAYALNVQSIEGPWQYNEGGYPILDSTGRLVKAPSWTAVGRGVQDGLVQAIALTIDKSTSTYLIKSPEQLGTFAYLVNAGNTGIHGQLNMDLNLVGERYGGSMNDPVLWEPIGTASSIFQGIFDGAGQVLGNLSVNHTGYAGLFGCAGGGAVIQNLGLDSSCKVVQSEAVAEDADGTAGFVGAVLSVSGKTDNITIKNCYNRASVHGNSGNTGAFVGKYDSASGGLHIISHCYNTGAITSSAGRPGAIAGSFAGYEESTGGIQRCYWDGGSDLETALSAVGGGTGTATDSYSEAKTTAYMKGEAGSDTANILLDLNTGNVDGKWSRLAGRNNEYPVFKVRMGAVDWGTVGASVLAPACQNYSFPGTAGTSANPYLIWTAEDLAWVSYQVNNQSRPGICAKVMTDINLFGGIYTGNSYGSPSKPAQALKWIPIGTASGESGYTGTFDGNGHTITMMHVEGTEKLGLFGTLGNGANISGIVLSDNLIEAEDSTTGVQYAGGIAGYVSGNNAKITDCMNVGLLEFPKAGAYFGGIAGYLTETGNAVTECGNTGTVTGAGDYLGGIVGGTGGGTGIVIDGCYNSSTGTVTNAGKTQTGGILGGSISGNAIVRNSYNQGKVAGGTGGTSVGGIAGGVTTGTQVTGCYNAGTVTGASSEGTVKSIAGSNSGSGNVTYSYYLSGSSYPSGSYPVDDNATGVEEAAFGTWGAAFALNGKKLGQAAGSISWTYQSGNAYPTYGMLDGAESWERVAEGVEYGLIGEKPANGGSTDPYQITTAEQLAWFAYQVNHVEGMSGTQAVLTADIDMKEAESKYKSAERLEWEPIGKRGTAGYTGSFESSNPADAADIHKIYQIQNLYVKTDGPAGLFGVVAGGNISRIGLSNAVVTGGNAGGIAGETSGAATIAQCYNRSENGGKGSVTASGNAGGIAGQAGAGTTIRDCYNLETTIQGTGTSSHAGGIAGDGVAGVIRNSYNACGETGSITASGTVTVRSITSSDTGTAGAVNGNPGTGAGMSQCYSDVGYADGSAAADRAFISRLYSTGNAQLKEQTAGLNTAGGRVNTLEDRLWYTSLAAEATKGYPTLEPPVMITLSEAVSPADSAAGVETALGASGPVANARFRYAAEESGDGTEVPLAAWNADNYSRYGYNSANKTIGLAAGTGASGSAGTILAPGNMSLEQPAQELGNVSRLTLFTAAAYTCPTARKMLVELSSGTTRYEIRFTVKGVTSKTLKVVMPVKVTMENLRPDQTLKNTDSVDLFITNQNDYPVDGSIVSVAARDGDTYAVLKPVSRDFTFVATDPITQGVKLKIVDQEGGGLFPAEGIYYNPGPPPSWISYRLKNGGTLPYRYRMEYQAFQYFDTKNQYSYDVTYRFGVSGEDDAADGTEVLIKQAGGKTDG